MGTEARAVEWYRSCIHDRQRKANTLSIEVELNAREKDDPGALAEAMNCLDSAIRVLEQANEELTLPEVQPEPTLRLTRKRTIPQSPLADPLMEDLGHSMESPGLAVVRPRPARTGQGRRTRTHAVDLRRVPFESSLGFFQ